MIKKFIQYITHDIWFKKENEYKSRKTRWAVRQIKVLIVTAQGFGEHSLLIRSAALTFYTLMALVPIIALVFSIAKGFSLDLKLAEYLHNQFPDYTALIDQLMIFANALLERTKGGILASVGVVVLFWSAIKVFTNVEGAFNNIWEVRKERSFARKITDYMAILLISPILFVISNGFLVSIRTHLLDITPSLVVDILFALFSIVVMCAMFGFIYYVMPNAKVKPRSAINAGIIAGVAFQLFQWFYVYIQSGVSQYNAIYGTFAVVPLFLIWTQTSWQILLIGAELSFSYQNIRKFEYEKMAGEISYDLRKRIMLAVMKEIVDRFISGKGGISSDRIASELNLPVRIVRDSVFELEKGGLLAAITNEDEKTSFYVPARDVHSITVFDVIRAVEKSGTDSFAGLAESAEMHAINEISDEFDRIIARSPQNILLMDVKIDPSKRRKK